MNDKSQPIVVPWQQLSAEALLGLIDEYINRDGTDYGRVELDLEAKRRRAQQAIRSGRVQIVFDPASESVTMLASDDVAALMATMSGSSDE